MTEPSVYGSTIDRVRAAASRNSEILVTLNKTQEAVHAYNRTEFSLRKHRAELQSQDRTVNTLKTSSHVKFEKHETYRDSLIVKYAYYAVCMMMLFHKKAKEYEQAYFEALKKQKDAEDRRAGLQKNLDDELARNKEFRVTAEVHGKAHEDLDNLYIEIFSQPTPEFPEQEELRTQYDLAFAQRLQAKERYDVVKVNLRSSEEERTTVREDLKTAALDAEEKRQALEIAREKVFEQVAGFGLAPPGYSDCCNRAEFQEEYADPPPFEEIDK
ncbi:MAG: hypothetical protein Q9165_006635 [Trypethelium subeluteriae]